MSLRGENKRKFCIHDQQPQQHPLEVNTFSRDLLQSFVTPNIIPTNFDEISQTCENEVELSLGLSLNGRFGVDPKKAKLSRSASIPELGNYGVQESPPPPPPPTLVRTFSLPSETGEEYLRRKEMQSMKRFQAKKKWLERMRKGKILGDRRETTRESKSRIGVSGEPDSNVQLPCPSRQGSTASSVITETGSPPHQGMVNRQAAYKNKEEEDRAKMMKEVLMEMPYVSTRTDGPFGKRTDGFLYRYNNGEEVRIVCVCHGSFLSPAEFVMHAGGKEVDQPLKHIVVNPFHVM